VLTLEAGPVTCPGVVSEIVPAAGRLGQTTDKRP
jgi:hypothetical protein